MATFLDTLICWSLALDAWHESCSLGGDIYIIIHVYIDIILYIYIYMYICIYVCM